MGLGAFPGTDKQFLGMLGMHGTVEANYAMHHSDVILAVGARFDDRVTNTPSKFCPPLKLFTSTLTPRPFLKTVAADIPIVGPVDAVLNEMLDLVQTRRGKTGSRSARPWWQQINEWRDRYGLLVKPRYSMGDMIKPQEVISMLWK